jgi:ribosomal protein L19
MNIINKLKKLKQNKYKNIPKNLKIGNIIHLRILLSKFDKRYQSFSGLCIGIKNKQNQSSFILKNLIYKEIIYKTIPLYSKLIKSYKIQPYYKNLHLTKLHASKLYNFSIKKAIKK